MRAPAIWSSTKCSLELNHAQKYKPRQLLYVSCNAATMARDLKTLQGKYTVSDICMMDLFPATYHFETLVRIEFKNHHKK